MMFFTIKNNTWKWPKPQTKQNRKTNNPLRAAKSPRSCSQVHDELLRVPLFPEIVHTDIQAGVYYVSPFVTWWSHALCHCSLLFRLSTKDLWQIFHSCCVLCLVSQSCLTLSGLMDCSPPGSSAHGDSPGQDAGVGCHSLLQGIFPTHGLSPGLPHCRQILYHLSHHGGPRKC